MKNNEINGHHIHYQVNVQYSLPQASRVWGRSRWAVMLRAPGSQWTVWSSALDVRACFGTMSVHSWEGKHGAKRIQAEFLYLTKLIAQGNMPQVHNLRLLDDNLFQWRFELKNFDEDMPGGKALNQDLKDLKEKHGQDHVLMEILFKEDYPTDPFFLRVVSPRCQWYTGHVRQFIVLQSWANKQDTPIMQLLTGRSPQHLQCLWCWWLFMELLLHRKSTVTLEWAVCRCTWAAAEMVLWTLAFWKNLHLLLQRWYSHWV